MTVKGQQPVEDSTWMWNKKQLGTVRGTKEGRQREDRRQRREAAGGEGFEK